MEKRKYIKRFLCLLTCFVCMACILPFVFKEEARADKVKTYDIDKDELPYSEDEIFEQLFNINNVIEIKVDMSNDQLNLMEKDYEKYNNKGSKSPIYRKADLYITIHNKKDGSVNCYKITEVGVRPKGNTTRSDFYSSKKGIYKLLHMKVDFQETFENKDDKNYYSGDSLHDWTNDDKGKKARKKRTFAGMEKLEMKWNINDDQTFIRDYYTNEFFRANGVLAAHSNLSSIDLGGEHMGVYTIYEPIDKTFIKRYVDKEDQGGDLYKCGWVNGKKPAFLVDSSIGLENEDKCEFYNYDKKTNKDEDHRALVSMISVLNKKSVTKSDVSSVIDMDYFLKFAAASYFTGNPDDMRNNYNNYYVYFKKSDNKAIFIPYDNDRTFGVTNGWNPTGDGCTNVNPYSTDAVGLKEVQENPVYIYTVDKGGYYVSEYAEELKKVAGSRYLVTATFNSIYNKAMNNYSAYTKPGKKFENASGYKFSFSNTATNGNLTFAAYLSAITKTFNKYKDPNSAVNQDGYYVVGTMNDWNPNTGFLMKKKSDGTYTYTFSRIKGDVYRFKVVKNAPEEGWQTGNNWGSANGDAINSQGRNWEYESLTINFNPTTKVITSSAVNKSCLKSKNGAHSYKTIVTKASTTKNGKSVRKCSCCGKVSSTTTIYKASNVSLAASSFVYNGKSIDVGLKVKDSAGKTIAKSNYTVSYPTGRKAYGKHTVVIKFKNKYSGKRTLSFVIRPPKSSYSKFVKGRNKLIVTYRKPAIAVSGYQLQLCTDNTFASSKTKNIKVAGNKVFTKTFSSLKSNTKYYLRIRTYRNLSNGKRVYSVWSTAQSVSTLK